MKIRKHYYVSGRVQGVGFRYRAYYVAKQLGLTGYAINLDDGRVELEVQGERQLVENFLNQVEESSTFIYIEDVESYEMKVDMFERKFYMD